MSSLDRTLDGEALSLDLARALQEIRALLPDSHGRAARTLLKSGPLRVTLIHLAPGGMLPEHAAAGPITVQPLEGALRLTLDGSVHEAAPGTILAVGAHVRHAVTSEHGVSFLLTVAMPDVR